MHTNQRVLLLDGVRGPCGGTKVSDEQTAAVRCSECDGLWRERSDALEEYLRILGERDAARTRRDHDLVEAFEEIENESLERCQNAQQAICDHEIAHLLENVGKDCTANPAGEADAKKLLLYSRR